MGGVGGSHNGQVDTVSPGTLNGIRSAPLRLVPVEHARETVRPALSIVIPTHNEGSLLKATVDAVLQNTTLPFEVVVVDDASIDGSCDFVERLAVASDVPLTQIRIVRQGRAGSAIARNTGAAHALSDVLVFLDAHCFPQRGWAEDLLGVLTRYPDCIATPSISCASNRSLRGFGVTTDYKLSYRWLDQESSSPYEVPIACGACLMVRKDVFFGLGGFDNISIWGVEDVELSIRAWLCGASVLVVPQAEVAHVFKEKANFRVSWKDWVHNAVRCAVLHFDDEQLDRLLTSFEALPEVPDAVEMICHSDIWERLEFVAAKRTRSAKWLCERFTIDI